MPSFVLQKCTTPFPAQMSEDLAREGRYLRGSYAKIRHAGFMHRCSEDDIAVLGPADSSWVIQTEGLCRWLFILYCPSCMSCLGLKITLG